MKNRAFLWTCVLAAVLALPSAVAAHIRVTASTPANGSTMTVPVSEVRITFSQRVRAPLTHIAIIGANGLEVPLLGITPSDSTGLEFAARLAEPLGNGAYTVRWRTAGADGHVVSGELAFTVEAVVLNSLRSDTAALLTGVPRSETEVRDSGAAPVAVIARWANFLVLLLAIGAAAMRSIIVPGARVANTAPAYYAQLERALRGLFALSGALIVLAAVPRFLVQASALFGSEHMFEPARVQALLTETAWGIGWWLQVGAGVVLVLAGRQSGRALAVIGAVILGVTPALSGHAVAVSGASTIAVASDTLHVLAAGTWLGSLAVIMTRAVPVSLRTTDGQSGLVSVVQAFSPVAIMAALIIVLTGSAAVLLQTTRLAQLWTTGYGRAILIKLAVVALLAVAGWFNWKRVKPVLIQPGSVGTLRRSAGLELTLAALVVLVTAVLVALPAPH